MNSKQLAQLKKLITSGMSLTAAGKHFGYSKEHIRLKVKEHFPELTRNDYGVALVARQKAEARTADFQKRLGRPTGKHATVFSKKCSLMFCQKRQNAKRTGWEWNLSFLDVEFPDRCPILGMKLDYSGKHRKENSPSFDRINPKKGYVKGNVIVCSWRANRIKNDGTAKEHELIAKFLRLH